MITVSITEEQIFQVLGTFLQFILPATVSVIRGQGNRVPEPQGTDFVVMWPILQERLSYNIDSFEDSSFVGSISGNTLTVTEMLAGVVSVGLSLDANGIATGTQITGALSGIGGVGTYTVNNSQTLNSTTIQAGAQNFLQPIKKTIQIDVHGESSADNAHIISTLFRDGYGVDAFNTIGVGIGQFVIGENAIGSFNIQPLYCDDPKQMPFMNAEQQTEERWIVQCVVQANLVVKVTPQQFADTVKVPITVVE